MMMVRFFALWGLILLASCKSPSASEVKQETSTTPVRAQDWAKDWVFAIGDGDFNREDQLDFRPNSWRPNAELFACGPSCVFHFRAKKPGSYKLIVHHVGGDKRFDNLVTVVDAKDGIRFQKPLEKSGEKEIEQAMEFILVEPGIYSIYIESGSVERARRKGELVRTGQKGEDKIREYDDVLVELKFSEKDTDSIDILNVEAKSQRPGKS